MVTMQKPSSSKKRSRHASSIKMMVLVLTLLFFAVYVYMWSNIAFDTAAQEVQRVASVCPYKSLDDLLTQERTPMKGKRHMVQPPADTLGVTLVCCPSTKGPISFLIHHSWAPLGAARFLDMLDSGYFTYGMPLFRCVKDWLCQFGISNNPNASRTWGHATFPDDPPWLPKGPEHRENEHGVKRFAKGYLAYAGGGNHSRSNQFILALHDDGPLAGGSPWEVPWGELVGDYSYDTIDKINTNYGENGPSQGALNNHGMNTELRQKYPDLDYIGSCVVVDEEGRRNSGKAAKGRRKSNNNKSLWQSLFGS